MAQTKRVSESTETVAEAFESAQAAVAELKREMTSWKNGLNGMNLEGSSKYLEIDCAEYDLADVLESLKTVYIPDDLEGTEVDIDIVRGTSRPKRSINVIARLVAVRDALESEDCETPHLTDAISVLEAVKFPLAFGGKRTATGGSG